jgi:hypothetical protein
MKRLEREELVMLSKEEKEEEMREGLKRVPDKRGNW